MDVRVGSRINPVVSRLAGTTSAIALVLGLSAVNPVLAQDAATEGVTRPPVVSLEIAPQSLNGAILAFADKAGIQVFYDTARVQGLRSGGVRGNYTPQEALGQILSGTGLAYRFTGARSVTIGGLGSSAPVSSDGSTTLDPIIISGRAGRNPRDTPYETPGSSSYISSDQLERLPPASAGDVFVGTPGVISAGNRVGASINPNIRGLQGNGRVNTTVDGARQSASSYRGYIGNRDEVYVDPDMIGGVDISKGPSGGVGVGGIGGTINFRTLEAKDIVKEGRNSGLRLKTDLGSNSIGVPPVGTLVGGDRPSFLNGDAWSGSVAAAATQESFDLIAAYSKRKTGNYFTGTKVPDGIIFGTTPGVSNAAVGPGSEAFNTSQDTRSALVKGTFRWADAHSLELGFTNYNSRYGEINELNFAPWIPLNQLALTETKVDTYTAKYRYQPNDNPYIDIKANAWLSKLDVERYANGFGPYGTLTKGGDISNTSRFDTGIGALTWENGLEIVNENATSTSLLSFGTWLSPGPIGERTMESGFTKATLQATDWLTLSAGARYDHYESQGKGYLSLHPETSGSRVNPNVGITIEPVDGLQLYGLYTEGYRPPSLRESHWNYGSLLQVNPNLQPELAKNMEFGINILRDDIISSGDSLRIKASVFNNNYKDYIVRRRPVDAASYIWDNIAEARYNGVELSVNYDAGRYFVEGNFTRYTKIEYCPTEDTCTPYALGQDYGGSYVPPTYAGSVTAGIRAFDEALTLGARTHFSSERSGGRNINGGFTAPQIWPRYQIVDFFGSYDFNDDLKMNFSVENAFDRYYIGALSSVGIASPGRTFRIGLTKTF